MANGAGYRQYKANVLFDWPDITKKGLDNHDFMQKLKWMTIGSTIHLVSNCEEIEDWDISDSANFNAIEETTDIRTGSGSLELVDAGTTTGTFVTLDEEHRPDSEDWSDFNWLCMWIHDDTAVRLTGELKVQIRNNGSWGTALNVPVVSNADVFEYCCIDISSLARSRVDGFRFVNNRGTGSSEKVYVDDIIVTDIITGNNATQVAKGPVIGPIKPFRIKTGETINPGESCNLEQGLLVTAGAENDVGLVGVACQHDAYTSKTATDSLPNEVWVAVAPAIIICRNDGTGCAAGDGVALASGAITLAEGTGEFETCIAKALETGTANIDSAFQLAVIGAEN